jgi:hypothetical protein
VARGTKLGLQLRTTNSALPQEALNHAAERSSKDRQSFLLRSLSAGIIHIVIYYDSFYIPRDTPTMICAVCYGVLRGHQGSQWRGTFDLHFDHQRNRTELEKSVAIACCFCRSIASELKSIEKTDRSLVGRALNGVYSSVGNLIWGQSQGGNGSNFIGAYLSEVPELKLSQEPKIYRLDFKLLQKDEERLGTFVLEKVGRFPLVPHIKAIF